MPNTKDDVYGDHISHQFNDELLELKTEFLKMGGMVEAQVERAIQALVDNDGHLADEVRATDKKVDQMEMEIDEEATLIIARRQPAARDLRLVISVIKMVADLERVGDEAKKIAKFAIKLNEEGQAPRGYVEVRHIGNHVLSMLHDALDAFARLDSEQALRIMKEDTRNISRCMSVTWVLRALERVGDHACNLAENVIFMVKGEDVRHTPVEEAEKVVGR